MKDIAAAAGVSIATVSRVLNDKPDVNPETRERVLAVLSTSGYRHRSSRFAAKETGQRLIGFVNASRLYPATGSYVSGLIGGVGERCSDHAYNLVLIEADSIQKETRWPGRYGIFEELSGVVWSMPVFQEIHREFLEDRGLPHVVINNIRRGVSAPLVESDNFMAARRAVEYLAGMGHTKIGFIGGAFEIANIEDRYRGYKQHMAEFGLQVNADWVVDDLASLGESSAIEGTYRLIGRRNLPTALICAAESVVLGAYKVFGQRGIGIPDDISILSYDDTPISELLNPPITTFRQPLERITENAVDILMDLIHHPEHITENPHIVEPLTLIVRDSVGEIDSAHSSKPDSAGGKPYR